MAGVGAAFVVALLREGWEGPVLAAGVPWPEALAWLGPSFFRSDALGAGLGLWCLLMGGLCVVKQASDGESPPRLTISLLLIATLYALTHTTNLIALAAEIVTLAGLVYAYVATSAVLPAPREDGWQLLALGLGAAMLLGAVTLIGRASGGEYDLAAMPLPALSVWPLLLLAGFALLWAGCVPFIGWSAGSGSGAGMTLVQALALGVPVAALLLRLQGLISAQSVAPAVPTGWEALTGTLGWAGAITALSGAAASLLYTGTSRFFAAVTACWLGLMLWALGLDTPLGRYSAIALLLVWGAARVAWEMAGAAIAMPNWGMLPRAGAALALCALPLSVGFVGIWLLGGALTEWGRPALALLPVVAAVLAACGMLLHFALSTGERPHTGRREQYAGWAAVGLAVALVVGGVLPGLWLPLAGSIASVAGGSASVTVSPLSISLSTGAELPILFLAFGALVLAGFGWLAVRIARRGTHAGSALLPAALEHLNESANQGVAARGGVAALASLLRNPPAPILWLSLGWIEDIMLIGGRALSALLTRAGTLLGRLEGRYYLPLALILMLVFLLAVTR
jgi:hypothetical protein